MRVWAFALLLGCGMPAQSERNGAVVPEPPAVDASHAPFACDERAPAAPGELRRLTMAQYRNTVRDLARWTLGDAAAADVAVARAGLEGLPVDRRRRTPQDPHGSYRRLDQALDQSHVDETYRLAIALGDILAASDRLSTVVGACASDADAANDEACVGDFIRRFGARALRAPLDEDEASFFRLVYGSDPTPDPDAYADVIAVMLSSPRFLYFVEHGEIEVPGRPGAYRLSAHELASRLSYHFWQTLPDDELWRVAEDGSLLRPEVLAREVQRLVDDSRTRTTMAELFSDLLRLEDVPDLPDPELRQHVIDEALDMLAHYTWTAPAGIRELFTSPLSFARTDDLAGIYGAPPWDGSSAPPVLPAGERVGLLTRAWFLASGSPNTRPIQRGVFIRRNLLCDELSPPPADANAVLPVPTSAKTTRRVVEELTEQPGTVCASCHAGLINPLGFTFEGFDALGRARTEQPLFDDAGKQVGALPVDAVTVPRVTPGDERVAYGPADLVQLLLESGKLEACLARNYFRFTFGRYEDVGHDGCALERLRARLVESGRIRDMLAEAALLPDMQERGFPP